MLLALEGLEGFHKKQKGRDLDHGDCLVDRLDPSYLVCESSLSFKDVG